jgi:chromosomal replication initiation ATPase DnaA
MTEHVVCPTCHRPLTVRMIAEDLLQAQKIIDIVAEVSGFPAINLMRRNNEARYVTPRYVAMHLVAQRTGLSYSSMSVLFERDRSTISYAIERCQNRLNTDLDYRKLYERVLEELKK